MAFSGQVLFNPVSGERFVFHTTAGDSAGRLLEFDMVVDPHGWVPGGQVHPRQQESFEVRAGIMKFRQGLTGQPGDACRRVPPSRRPVPASPGAGRASGTHPRHTHPGSSRPAQARPGAAALTARQRTAAIRGESE